jgi:hypothetical protein
VSFAETPEIESTSYVGADSSSASTEFQPFANLLKDELLAALPVEPKALSFDIGRWLTECDTGANDASQRHDRPDDSPVKQNDEATPVPKPLTDRPTRVAQSQPPAARETPLARAGHWVRCRFDAAHRERRRRGDNATDSDASAADAAEPADAATSAAPAASRLADAMRSSLQQRDEAAAARLGVERRNLALAAQILRRFRKTCLAESKSAWTRATPLRVQRRAARATISCPKCFFAVVEQL